MSRPWMLVTPASRGLGFALARHLLQTTRLPLVATARSDLPDLHSRLLDGLDKSRSDPERLRVLRLDVTGTVPFFIWFIWSTRLRRLWAKTKVRRDSPASCITA